MKIKKLEVNNFRGFQQATVDFPESNLAVFIGVNGQGKSSLLDLAAIFLNYIPISLIEGNYSEAIFTIHPTDINFQKKSSKNEFVFSYSSHGIANLKCDAEIEEYVQRWGLTDTESYKLFLGNLKSLISTNKEKASLPTLLYYRANRFLDNNNISSDETLTYETSQFAVFENAFSKKITGFTDFINWFRNEEDIENELIKKERNFEITNPNLQAIRKAITLFFSKLNDSFFSNLRVERDAPKNRSFAAVGYTSSLVISKNNQSLRLEQLSDGEKMLLMVICDIARRLTIANPGLIDPLEGHGIVLIDEIELHLHPKWQREVIPALLATFPNIQFLVTTHSPQVLSRVDKEDIFLLKDGMVLPLAHNPKGMDTNAILEEIMDTPKYPKEVDELVNELFSLIQQRKFDLVPEARRKVANASPDNPVLQRADAMMERLKILN